MNDENDICFLANRDDERKLSSGNVKNKLPHHATNADIAKPTKGQ